MTKTPEDIALAKAKIALMQRPESTFFTTLCFGLKTAWDSKIPFAATDYKTIFFNPQKFLSLTPGQRVFLLLHETLHVAFLHWQRQGSKQHGKWNAACDFHINLLLTDHGFERIPEGLYDDKYRDPSTNQPMSSEQIYALLPEDQSSDKDLMAPPDDQNLQELEQDVQDLIMRAVTQAKMAGDKPGSIPSDIQVYVDSLVKPKLPYHTILRRYLQSYAKNDYSMRRPNRRFFPKHHLPSLWSESLMAIDFGMDISVSVQDHQFQQFVGDIAGVMKMMQPPSMRLVRFNTRIAGVDTIRSIQELKQVEFRGRGGTAIGPLLEWANENKSKVLLIYTDGEFDWPKITCRHTDIIWLIHGNPSFTAPFGRVIHYEI